MIESLRTWFVPQFQFYSAQRRRNVLLEERMRKCDLDIRGVPLTPRLTQLGPALLFDELSGDQRLDVIDWVVYDTHAAGNGNSRALIDLEEVLARGSSMWRVGLRGSFAGLERRVPAGVQVAAEETMASSGAAGEFLADAWTAAYGRNPDAASAYIKAVQAVEAAATPIVSPQDGNGSLSKVIGQMRTDGDWTVAIDKEHPQNPLDKLLLDMMQALMSGHGDRHPGTPQYLPSTPEAAMGAVGLAVTLVQWFSAEVVVRRSKTP